jgi:hypothetical protein
MVNPNRFYTYAYLREDRTPYYIGKGTGKRIFEKRKRCCRPPKDKSRIIFLKQNITEEEAFKHEIYMIAVFGRIDLGTGILHNRTDGGEGASGAVVSEETRRKKSELGKISSQINKKNGTGIFSLSAEEKSELGRINGKKSAETNKKNKTGIYSHTKEDLIEFGKKSAKKHKELGIGFYKLTAEQRSENGKMGGKIGGKIAGRKNYENKTACFSITPEQRVEINKKTNSQKWMCLETEFVTTAGPLTQYQRKRGIDTSKRKRIA